MTTAQTAIVATVLFALYLGTAKSEIAPTVPCPTHLESLVYEPIARQTSIQGDVVLEIEINDAGAVSRHRLISGHPLLAKEAEKNISSWRFRAGTAATFRVTYEFRLVKPVSDKNPIPIISYDLPYKIRVTSRLPPVDHGPGDSLP